MGDRGEASNRACGVRWRNLRLIGAAEATDHGPSQSEPVYDREAIVSQTRDVGSRPSRQTLACRLTGRLPWVRSLPARPPCDYASESEDLPLILAKHLGPCEIGGPRRC
jgi:hypothetical protein